MVFNLIKNRRFYYSFALATCVAVAISYIFNSLAFNPNLSKMTGASSVILVLVLGVVIVNITAGIIVFYANQFVMKNRSKELGLYGMLGLNKRHLMESALEIKDDNGHARDAHAVIRVFYNES